MLNNLPYARNDKLGEWYFILTILLAVLLHLAGLYAWSVAPATRIVDIPVHALNVRLGEGDEPSPEELKAVQPKTDNNDQVEDYLSRLVRSEEQEKAKAAELAVPKDIQPAPEPVKQYVHTNPKAAIKTEGSDIGNSHAHDATIISRYEQLISLWIKKFKVYPDVAQQENIEGEGVVRIRTDRQGNILFCVIARSTGNDILDRAAVDMVRRANPVPAVPDGYPAGELQEFLVPVNFSLTDKHS